MLEWVGPCRYCHRAWTEDEWTQHAAAEAKANRECKCGHTAGLHVDQTEECGVCDCASFAENYPGGEYAAAEASAQAHATEYQYVSVYAEG
jgi:hypothetical protein